MPLRPTSYDSRNLRLCQPSLLAIISRPGDAHFAAVPPLPLLCRLTSDLGEELKSLPTTMCSADASSAELRTLFTTMHTTATTFWLTGGKGMERRRRCRSSWNFKKKKIRKPGFFSCAVFAFLIHFTSSTTSYTSAMFISRLALLQDAV